MDADLVRFAGSLSGCGGVEELRRAFVARALPCEFHGVALGGERAWAHVSDAFAAAYEREAARVDPVLACARTRGRPVSNRALMTAAEWEETPAYRSLYWMHAMRYVVIAPVGDTGFVHLGSSSRGFDEEDVALAGALACALRGALERIEERCGLARERDELAAALDVTGTAVVVSNPDLVCNAAARRVLAGVVDAHTQLHHVLARPAADEPFSRRREVELVAGGSGVLEAASTPVARGLVSVLALHRDGVAVTSGALGVLTPRETDVALLVADGLGDREIAGRLFLSHHTVSQHVKRIYRKLGVDSRVALTRLLMA